MSNTAGRFIPANYSVSNPITRDTGLGWEYIRIINNSPYLLQVSMGNQGTIDFPEMFLEDILVTSDYNGKLVITPFANFTQVSIGTALSSLISISLYRPGELAQPQAVRLDTLTSVGNAPLIAQSVINDGNAAGTTVVEATPSGAGLSKLLFHADGSGNFGGNLIVFDSAGRMTAVKQTIATTVLGNGDQIMLVFQDIAPAGEDPWNVVLGVDNSVSLQDAGASPFVGMKLFNDKSGQLSAGQITWDTIGELTTPRAIVTDRFLFNGPVGAGTKIIIDILPSDAVKHWQVIEGNNGTLEIVDATDAFNGLVMGANKSGNIAGGQITWGTTGILSVPDVLEIAGTQETGHYFTQFVAPSAVAWVFWVAFRKQMTNVPSSVTLSGATATNCTATVSNITKTGFRLNLTPTGAGTTSWDGDWTTVGN